MKILTNLILFAIVFNAFSQLQGNLLSQNALQRNLGSSPAFSMVQVKSDDNYNTEGTTYFIKGLRPGKIRIIKNEGYIEGVEIRYDIFYEQLQVKANNVFFAAENELISDFVINDENKSHWFHNSRTYAPELGLGYIRSIYKGEQVSIFAKDSKRERKTDSSEPYSSVDNTIEYLDETDYYIYTSADKGFVEVKSKKKLLESFPSLEDFGNISKSKLKDETFLPQLAMFLEKSN